MSELPPTGDHAALRRAARGDAALCTIVGIDGSFSRRVGAQLAVAADGSRAGDMADRCLDE
jgi:xanthine dehydrogenase accessory factor